MFAAAILVVGVCCEEHEKIEHYSKYRGFNEVDVLCLAVVRFQKAD